ncbi:MAG: nucleotide-binding universal stress UspA family protein [Rhodoferax sp.]|jgi:nucleotide-binding universal stress UspA family protein
MNKVYACVDGLAPTPCVIDWAVWSAQRLNVPLALLHILARHDNPGELDNYSGAIGFGAQESLLQELSALDGARGKLAQEAGRQLLDKARERAEATGALRLETRLRHGELVDNAVELEVEVRLFVLGEHEAASGDHDHVGHNIERVIRSVKRPVLVAKGLEFVAPARFMIAFDGSETGRKTVSSVARSPLLTGLPVLLAMAGDDTPRALQQLEEARQTLATAGFQVTTELRAGEPEQVLPALITAQAIDLLVIGAYGHSRIRQLIVGSTTSLLLRLSSVPVLVLR